MTTSEPPLLRRIHARVMENQQRADALFVVRLQVPGLPLAQPGQFVQLSCGVDLTLPRPFSIFDSQPDSIDLFYRVVGQGTQRMAAWKKDHITPLLGPIGQPFTPPPAGGRALLVGGGVGLAPLDFFARQLARHRIPTTLLWGLESDMPFATQTEAEQAGLPEGLALSHLLAHHVPNRLSSLTARPGFFQGYVTDLTRHYLQQLSQEERDTTQIYTCGPTPMMAAVASVARHFGLQGQASLEAQMACGFGVCVGCVVPIQKDNGWNYRRVCVDGPVFSLAEVEWERIRY